MNLQSTLTRLDWAAAEALSERLADVFRTGRAGDVFSDDLFFDGHPPFWRFQLQGIGAFAAWLAGYASGGVDVEVLRTVPTASGFVTEHHSVEQREDEELTSRKILLCEVCNGRIAALTVYCSGDWDEPLRARHAADTPMLRP